MTNAELIKALRNCSSPTVGSCTDCPYYKGVSCKWQMMEDAADALEEADKRIAELMPKEGEWIMDCLAPQMDEHRIGQWAYAPKCSECGTHWDAKTNYCPSCGAKMQTVTDCHTLEEGKR